MTIDDPRPPAHFQYCKYCESEISLGGRRGAEQVNRTVFNQHQRVCKKASKAERAWWRLNGKWNMPKWFEREFLEKDREARKAKRRKEKRVKAEEEFIKKEIAKAHRAKAKGLKIPRK